MNIKIESLPNCYFVSSKVYACESDSLFYSKDEKIIYYLDNSDIYLDIYRKIDCVVYEINGYPAEVKDKQILYLIFPKDDNEISFLVFSQNIMQYLENTKCETPIRTSIKITEYLINFICNKSEGGIQFSQNVACDDFKNVEKRHTYLACYFYFILKQNLLSNFIQSRTPDFLSNLLNKLIESIVHKCTNEVKTVDDSLAKIFDEIGFQNNKIPFFFIVYYFLTCKEDIVFDQFFNNMKNYKDNRNLRLLMSDLISSYCSNELSDDYSLLAHDNKCSKIINRYGNYCDFIFPILVTYYFSHELKELSSLLKKVADIIGSPKLFINQRVYNDLNKVKTLYLKENQKKKFKRKDYFSLFGKNDDKFFFDRLEHSPNIVTNNIMSCIIFLPSSGSYVINENNFSNDIILTNQFLTNFLPINLNYFNEVTNLKWHSMAEKSILFVNNILMIWSTLQILQDQLTEILNKKENYNSYLQDKILFLENKELLCNMANFCRRYKNMKDLETKGSIELLCKEIYFSDKLIPSNFSTVVFSEGKINKTLTKNYQKILREGNKPS